MKKQPKNLEEIKLFCEQHNLTLAQLIYGELIEVLSEKKADYTIQEIIELTKGQYGSESFKQFFIK